MLTVPCLKPNFRLLPLLWVNWTTNIDLKVNTRALSPPIWPSRERAKSNAIRHRFPNFSDSLNLMSQSQTLTLMKRYYINLNTHMYYSMAPEDTAAQWVPDIMDEKCLPRQAHKVLAEEHPHPVTTAAKVLMTDSILVTSQRSKMNGCQKSDVHLLLHAPL